MNDFVVSVYNPLARDLRNTYIRIPVTSPVWDVTGHEGKSYGVMSLSFPRPYYFRQACFGVFILPFACRTL